jgi:hypothetical protein
VLSSSSALIVYNRTALVTAIEEIKDFEYGVKLRWRMLSKDAASAKIKCGSIGYCRPSVTDRQQKSKPHFHHY